MNLQNILSAIKPEQAQNTLSIPKSWHQGRTCYGGLSAVIALEAARQSIPDLPPLQSGQVAFIGPLAGEVTVETSLLRRGRNSAFIQATIHADGQIALSCIFIFMAQRDSSIALNAVRAPDFPAPPSDAQIRSGPPEFFTGQMQYPDKRIELGMNMPRLASWHRLKEYEGADPLSQLVCIADALPPSAMGLMNEKGVVSSMNWHFNMLTDAPSTKDGWWFLESETHFARNGASSQYMTAWNSEGTPMMTGMQSVAIFV
jgi:acyl-CoA thioesterase